MAEEGYQTGLGCSPRFRIMHQVSTGATLEKEMERLEGTFSYSVVRVLEGRAAGLSHRPGMEV